MHSVRLILLVVEFPPAGAMLTLRRALPCRWILAVIRLIPLVVGFPSADAVLTLRRALACRRILAITRLIMF